MDTSLFRTSRTGAALPALAAGFAAAVGLWCAWFVTHAPGVALPAPIRAAALLFVLAFVFFMAGRWVGRRRALWVGLGAGATAGLLSLLLLGALVGGGGGKGPDTVVSDRSMNLAVFSAGFIALSAVTGAVAALIGGGLRAEGVSAEREDGRGGWLYRFSLVTMTSTAALLVIGAIVTSTESGMAVPDWPTTFSDNMFLFPMDEKVQPRIFYEHAHRLFGALTGLTTIALMVLILWADPRRSVKIFSIVLAVAVVVQGVLGGLRVTENNAFLGIFHGVLAQLFFGATVAMAVVLSPTFRAGRTALQQTPFDRRLRLFATGFLHTLIVQLILGATFRHLSAAGGDAARGAMHALYTHAAFAVAVAIFASAAGFIAVARANAPGPLSSPLRKLGWTAIGSVLLQIALGVAALVVVVTAEARPGVPTHDQLAAAPGVPFHEAAITTAHHVNGVLLMAVAAALFMWGKFVSPRR